MLLLALLGGYTVGDLIWLVLAISTGVILAKGVKLYTNL